MRKKVNGVGVGTVASISGVEVRTANRSPALAQRAQPLGDTDGNGSAMPAFKSYCARLTRYLHDRRKSGFPECEIIEIDVVNGGWKVTYLDDCVEEKFKEYKEVEAVWNALCRAADVEAPPPPRIG